MRGFWPPFTIPKPKLVRSYHPDKTEENDPEILEAEAQAYRYFTPALRDILYDSENIGEKCLHLTPVKEWHLPQRQIASWELHLGKEGQRNNPLRYQVADITSVSLYRYFNGIYLLAFRAKPKALAQLSDQDPLFDPDPPGTLEKRIRLNPENEAIYKQLQLECWLNFTRLARLIYPSFPQQNREDKIAPITLLTDKESITAFGERQQVSILKEPGKDISPVLRYLLKAFACIPENLDAFFDDYHELHDDRLFVSAAYSLAGRQLPEQTLQKRFRFALYTDRHEEALDPDGNFYTPEEIDRRAHPLTMGLWKKWGGIYGYTGFSNIYLYRGFFFRNIIAPEHIPYIYDRMLIQALFYQASLRYYDDIICRKTQELLNRDDLKSIRQQRRDFIRFTNQYWFHQLTAQMQGQEIFRLQQEALGLQAHYEIIKDELERTDEYLQTVHEVRLAEFSQKVGVWGMVIAVFGLYYTALSLMPEGSRKGLLQGLEDVAQIFPHFIPRFVWTLFGIPSLIVATLGILFFLWRQGRKLWYSCKH